MYTVRLHILPEISSSSTVGTETNAEGRISKVQMA